MTASAMKLKNRLINQDMKSEELNKIIDNIKNESDILIEQIAQKIEISNNNLKDEIKENENQISKNAT